MRLKANNTPDVFIGSTELGKVSLANTFRSYNVRNTVQITYLKLSKQQARY